MGTTRSFKQLGTTGHKASHGVMSGCTGHKPSYSVYSEDKQRAEALLKRKEELKQKATQELIQAREAAARKEELKQKAAQELIKERKAVAGKVPGEME